MKSLKKQRRIQLIAVAVVALIGSTALIGYGMRDGINFFRAPSQVMAEPPSPTEVRKARSNAVRASRSAFL